MEHPSRQPTAGLRSSLLQARALHFLKKLGLRTRGSKKKSGETSMSPVAVPIHTHDYQRAHSSLDLRKPDISRLIGFRPDDGPNPMDTDDSSQDVSMGGNSPVIRHRRHSAWDSLRTAPIESTFAAHGGAPLFCREQAGFGTQVPDDDLGNVLAPASFFLRSNLPDNVDPPPPPPSASEPFSLSGPSPTPQIVLSPESKPEDEPPPEPPAQEDTPRNEDDATPRPSGDVFFLNDAMTTPSTDSSPSIPSAQTSLPDFQSRHIPEASTSKTVVESSSRSLTRHLGSLQLPPFRVTTERGLRLSPSIITRHPMPILNLPTLPPPMPAPIITPSTRIPLRSMPSLSRNGHRNMDIQADHENATLGDTDEEDVEDGDGDDEEEPVDGLSVHQSDEEDDEPPSAGPSVLRGFKSAQKRRMLEGTGSPTSPVSPPSSLSSPNVADYFSSETYVKPIHMSFAQDPSHSTMYPFSPHIPHVVEDIHLRNGLTPDLAIPGVRLENKPSLYRVASRSMINLGSTRRVELSHIKSRETVRSNAPSIRGTLESNDESEESETEVIGRLLRRTSMPSFHPTSDPPPYPTFNPRTKEHRISPREDEGQEPLPPYSNSLYLLAIMPRKMEFSSPGVQARDRKWRRVMCELEGTAFRVYKCPPGASGAGVLGDWWEKRMGVGDVASPTTSVSRQRKKEDPLQRSSKLEIEEPPTPIVPSSSRSTSVPPVSRQTRQRSESQSSMATHSTMTTPTPRAGKRISGASFFSPFRSSNNNRSASRGGVETPSRPASRALELLPVDVHSGRSSLSGDSHGSNGRATPGVQPSPVPQPRSASRLSFLPGASTRLQWRSGEIPKPHKSDLIRTYTLQHAESGLGNDYLKRKNVIRVRLEGEQFLLQAPDVPSVVEWIEGLHAGTNIALDLDQRLMPRGPMFPRRRRRRARRAQVEEAGQQSEPVVAHRLA